MLNGNIKEKNILITGASSGIGEAIARHLHSLGATVILVARSVEKLNSMQEELKERVHVFSLDLSHLEDIEDIFLFCKEKSIFLDGLVHAAGISVDIPIKALRVEDMQEMMTVNYFSYVQLGKYFANRKYSKDGASIVAFSSAASFMCDKGMSQYSASKAAINATTKTMAKEFINRKIRVNAIAPAFVDTDMTWNVANYVEGFCENINKTQPLGIIPKEQISYLVEFLLSDCSKYITGNIIPVTGGTSLNI